eukprot:CAMPEP_0113314216 /NCGR_PEP_ID=MMETSP0010_2-20120614/10362_1 /TAXON_ID=216773 ORGANISM="Corethron hystrix, Strain 308" /NCGR_SAMPLE_ID=MMETSP0010_2 /ASSEMBLY_ACC=CAM_ASM_000155 /LENGTH=349 /DNA_ID=CAMNT_0000170451 /DNA_START=281 /DNA_END=1330 /DNA_ORIENTATION=+ /assembly_acc=CAM_ASM_000155
MVEANFQIGADPDVDIDQKLTVDQNLKALKKLQVNDTTNIQEDQSTATKRSIDLKMNHTSSFKSFSRQQETSQRLTYAERTVTKMIEANCFGLESEEKVKKSPLSWDENAGVGKKISTVNEKSTKVEFHSTAGTRGNQLSRKDLPHCGLTYAERTVVKMIEANSFESRIEKQVQSSNYSERVARKIEKCPSSSEQKLQSLENAQTCNTSSIQEEQTRGSIEIETEQQSLEDVHTFNTTSIQGEQSRGSIGNETGQQSLENVHTSSTLITQGEDSRGSIGIETEKEKDVTSSEKEQISECCICLEHDPVYAFIPCGHLVLCSICADMMKNRLMPCPICRVDPKGLLKITK